MTYISRKSCLDTKIQYITNLDADNRTHKIQLKTRTNEQQL